jgi:hypothetical protein
VYVQPRRQLINKDPQLLPRAPARRRLCEHLTAPHQTQAWLTPRQQTDRQTDRQTDTSLAATPSDEALGCCPSREPALRAAVRIGVSSSSVSIYDETVKRASGRCLRVTDCTFFGGPSPIIPAPIRARMLDQLLPLQVNASTKALQTMGVGTLNSWDIHCLAKNTWKHTRFGKAGGTTPHPAHDAHKMRAPKQDPSKMRTPSPAFVREQSMPKCPGWQRQKPRSHSPLPLQPLMQCCMEPSRCMAGRTTSHPTPCPKRQIDCQSHTDRLFQAAGRTTSHPTPCSTRRTDRQSHTDRLFQAAGDLECARLAAEAYTDRPAVTHASA